jgi:two-component system sensor histidine kinase UhpB
MDHVQASSPESDLSETRNVTEHAGSRAAINYLQLLVERDKTTLAREIHDDLGGYLVATAMDIAVLKRRFAGHDEDSARVFERVTHTINAAIDMMRRKTEELRPTLLDNVGLLAALRWQIKEVCRRLAVQCDEHMPETEPQLTPSELISIFRAGQESLLVAENQARVTEIDFTLAVEAGVLSFGVLANGSSALPSEDSRGYVALALLRQRVTAMGGTVDLGIQPLGGIHLTARIPLTVSR